MACEARHKAQTITEGLHSAISFEFDDETDRLGGGPYESYDKYKIAIQTDDNSLWCLVNDVTETWVQITEGQSASTVKFNVIKGSAGTISPGQVVYGSGWSVSGDIPEVELAQANSEATMPAIGVSIDTITDGTSGEVVSVGLVRNIDTSSFSVGDAVHVSPSVAGGLTAIPPDGPNVHQNIGVVVRSDVSDGVIIVLTGADEPLSDTDGYISEISDDTSDAGTNSDAARADHVHAHGDRGGGSLHELADESQAGFLSADGYVKLSGLTPGGEPNQNAFSYFTDGSNTASADSETDTFKFRSANDRLSVLVTNDEVTHGDNLLLTLNESNIDHGNLSGLEDDDHSNYLLVDGSRAMAGDLDMDGYDILNVGTVDGFDLSDLYTNTQEPTGFPNRTDSTISVNDGTRTFTIQPAVSSFDFYIKGIKFTKTSAQNIVWPDTEGLWFFAFDSNGDLTYTNSSSTVSSWILGSAAFVSAIYWDGSNSQSIYFAEERHGFMDGKAHLHFHNSFGAQWFSGGLLLGIDADQSGDSNSHTQFGVEDTEIADEDIILSISHGSPQTLNNPAQIPIFYRSGASGYWRKKTADAFPVIYSGTAGYTGSNGRLPYNEFTGATWQLTEVGQAEFVLVHYFASNNKEEPIIGIQGQNSYSNSSDARAGADTEMNELSGTGQLLSKELVPLGTVIFQTSTGYSNTPAARIVSTSDGDDYVDFRGNSFTGGGSSAVITAHGSLNGLDADDHTIYLLVDGTRAMSGNLDMGTNNITNVGTVDGVDISDHSSRHDPGGADALTTAAPTDVGDANAEGSAGSFARSDHVHALGGTVGGDLSGSLPNPTVTDLTISSEEQGSILYNNGSNWVQLSPGEDGYVLTTHDTGSNPTWEYSGSGVTDHGDLEGLSDDDHCFSEDTELLTNRGFVHYSDISNDEIAATFNLETSKIEYQKINDKYVYNNFNELIRFKNKLGEILVTPKHTMVYRNTTQSHKKRTKEWFLCTAEEALHKSVFEVPVCGIMDGYDLPLSDDMLELFGLIISEGSFADPKRNGYGIRIYQKEGTQADYIENILIKLGVPYTKHFGQAVVFYLRSNWCRNNIRPWLMEKNIPESLMNLRGRQFRYFLSGLVFGDGSVRSNHSLLNKTDVCLDIKQHGLRKNIQYHYYSGDVSLIDNLVHLCTINGYKTYSYYRSNVGFKNGCWSVNISCKRKVGFCKTSIKDKIQYNGNVWCVSVPNKTLVLRRKGFVFIAGNTQYLLVSGTRAMSGNLDMGTNNITNVGTVDGVDISDHSSRHDPGGADALTTAAPTDVGDANAEGSAGSFARSDHVHALGGTVGGDLSGSLPNPTVTDLTISSEEQGSVLYNNGSNWVQLPPGDDGYVLTTHDTGANPTWEYNESGVTDHGDLEGLSDDDHSIYLLVDGTRAMSGNLDMGTNNITNVGTVDGIDVSDHSSRHDPGGADALTTAAPTDVGDANAEGSAGSFARSDHVHALGGTVGGDLSGSLPNPTVTDLTISSEEQGSVLYNNGSNWVQLPPGDDGYVLTTHDTGANPTWEASSETTRRVIVEFTLTENVNNVVQWFTTWRSPGGDKASDKRSGTSTGIQNADSCSPFQVPFDATIIKAVLTVKGVGVQNGSVSYPVTYQTDLYEEDFTTETKIADIDFTISNSYTVGTWSVGNTNYKGSVSLDIDVSEGDMLALKFINGTGASLAGQSRMAFVTLLLEER